MKKILIGTTALLAAGAFVSTAQASDPIKLKLGGYMEYWVAAADQDGDYKKTNRVNNVDVQGESEVWFVGSTTLDNGMKISVQIELEAGSNQNGDDTIDESYMTLEGKYGKAIIGSENDVAYLSHFGAPVADQWGYGIGTESDTIMYLPIPVSYLEPIITITGDANKVSYFTPKFYGFQAGVSYVPSNNTSGDDQWFTSTVSGTTVVTTNSENISKAVTGMDDAWAFVLNYSNTFAGVGVKASGQYVMTDDASGSTAGTAAGKDGLVQDFAGSLSFSYQGFTLGGAAHRRVADIATASAVRATDGVAWDVGLMYAEGPYAVSLGYYRSDVLGGTRNDNRNDTVDVWKLGGKYALGPGVAVTSQIAYTDAQDESKVKTSGNEGAWGGAVGLRLDF